jgi:DNA-binding MarR family transcriptional regulator
MTAPEPQDEQLERFNHEWERFHRAVKRARARVPDDRQHGLTLAQYMLLAPLTERSPRAVRELADAAGVAGPTATRLLDSLEAGGYVERRPSERDRRSVDVSLTPDGKRQLDETREWVNEGRRRVYDALEPAERQEAERLLARLADIVERS